MKLQREREREINGGADDATKFGEERERESEREREERERERAPPPSFLLPESFSR